MLIYTEDGNIINLAYVPMMRVIQETKLYRKNGQTSEGKIYKVVAYMTGTIERHVAIKIFDNNDNARAYLEGLLSQIQSKGIITINTNNP